MFKAPIGRVATLQEALATDLRNLPVIEPSAGMFEALLHKLNEMSCMRGHMRKHSRIAGARRTPKV
jgi:hypothetical protein